MIFFFFHLESSNFCTRKDRLLKVSLFYNKDSGIEDRGGEVTVQGQGLEKSQEPQCPLHSSLNSALSESGL